MNFLKFRLFLLLLLILFPAKFAFAQCEGAYFKTTEPTILNSERGEFYQRLPPKDLTGDNKADLVGVGYNGSNIIDKILILPADGQGGFASSPVQIPVPTSICCFSDGVHVVDFNKDGKNDILAHLSSNPPSVLVFRNDGGNSFTPLTLSILAVNEFIRNVVDINNDNIADLLTYTLNPPQQYYRFGNSNGTFGAQVGALPADYHIAADFNNDGLIDFPVKNDSTSERFLRIYYNQGQGIFFTGNNFLNIGSTVITGVADFNNDGKIDLYGSGGAAFTVFKNSGNDNFSKTDYPYPSLPFGVNFTSLKLGDFNGDNFIDILLPTGNHPLYWIYTNDGTGNFTRREYNAAVVNGYPFGSLDSDNKTDLVTVDSFQPFQVTKLFNETRVTVQKNVCNKQGQTRLVDFNADLITNKTLFRPADARWRYRQSIFDSVATSFFWGINGDIPTPGDYDGDGKTDFAIYRPSNGYWYARRSSDLVWYVVKWGIEGDKPVPADYDADGKTDAAVYRPSDGNWYVFYTGTLQYSITRFGIAEDKPVPADFDGDEKADLAVFRPSTGIWYYLKSSDANAVSIQWGISSDKPVPADYDGDLKADIAVFRESEGKWYILRSHNLQFAVFSYGLAGDVPQPGDYNGDNLLDLGIYRPSNRLWYTSDTTYQTIFGDTGEVPISYILRVE